MGSNRRTERLKLIGFWLERRPEERTENHVMEFYWWVEKNHPTLLARYPGDPTKESGLT